MSKNISLSCMAVIFALAIFVATGFHATAQTSSKQEDLIQAQTNYYQAQTDKLKEPSGFWGSLRSNPASAIGVLGAVVALISFVLNYRVTIKNQKDIQFYEALKRFGDEDSATVRLSAAVLIEQLATSQVRDYLYTALDQLLGGLQLERDPIVLNAITHALKRLSEIRPSIVVVKLYEINLALEEALVVNLAHYLQALKKRAKEQDLTTNVIEDRYWSEAIVVTRLPTSQLELWTDSNRQTFYRTLLSSGHHLTNLKPEDLKEHLRSIENNLELSSERTRLNDLTFAHVYLGMFLPKKEQAQHRQKMEQVIEGFLMEIANRRGLKAVPQHWRDLQGGRTNLRRVPPPKESIP